MDRIRVDLSGPPQTMLATLYAKALDADAPNSILSDHYAKAAVTASDIVDAVPGVRLLAWESVFDSDTFDLVPPFVRWVGRAMAAVPALRTMAQYHRYAFGPVGTGKC